ncbi:hypothetical protein HYPSUDRAFT_32641 [Hypholoma sublateritium FD-334 SS-4]|uniref:Uncharacterized protein n=1 Tax=Hypholoma sublateritium (strain FD-334 SS-4) TaxID=945553 RepID=A0A0D2MYT8_HYPSF|nr:hypothetical protein HYPSUDRAFT_32641 [Hypholoma sublateritium FD-334 SS-4]
MSTTSSRQRAAPSLTSSASIKRVASSSRRPPPPISTVVTSPPWARDEPPSPTDQTNGTSSPNNRPHFTDYQLSDAASIQSNAVPASRWWTFTLPRTRPDSFDHIPSSARPERRTLRDLSLSWMPTSANQPEGSTFARGGREKTGEEPPQSLSIPMPAQLPIPYTLAHTNTPGWDTPWTARPNAQGPNRHNRLESYGFEEDDQSTSSPRISGSKWSRRKKRIRSFILVNTYVPLLFRFINIAFTTAALGIAIRIRALERKKNATGAIGSSPSVVIIFAPLTLVHVMIAIYLEYFGRPLGLWRTSAKLAHTLSEVLFICLWSAALSLCFDNFFTSLIPCTSESATAWYNQIPRPQGDVPTLEGSTGDQLCDEQLSLICLVGIGLIAYCSNLIISLYRVFEKVKYHPVAPMSVSMMRRT